jgi:hypothetical protein
MKNADFWDVTPCGSGKNRPIGGMCRLHHQGDKNRRASKTLAATSSASRCSETSMPHPRRRHSTLHAVRRHGPFPSHHQTWNRQANCPTNRLMHHLVCSIYVNCLHVVLAHAQSTIRYHSITARRSESPTANPVARWVRFGD